VTEGGALIATCLLIDSRINPYQRPLLLPHYALKIYTRIFQHASTFGARLGGSEGQLRILRASVAAALIIFAHTRVRESEPRRRRFIFGEFDLI
jgi:hypothetical protein